MEAEAQWWEQFICWAGGGGRVAFAQRALVALPSCCSGGCFRVHPVPTTGCLDREGTTPPPGPPPPTVDIAVAKNDIYRRNNDLGHSWYAKFGIPDPSPPPLLSSNTCLLETSERLL